MEIYTIGFAGKTAERFFEALRDAGIQQLVDVRLNNTSQLAGFTKKADIPYFLGRLANIDYRHEPSLAPTTGALRAYRSRVIDWAAYEAAFLDLMAERDLPGGLNRSDFSDRIVLLCSEASPEKCHRRLVAELLSAAWDVGKVEHL